MKRARLYFGIFYFVLSVSTLAQEFRFEEVKSLSSENKIEVQTNQGIIGFEFLTPEAVEVSFYSDSNEELPVSHAVEKKATELQITFSESDHNLVFGNDVLQIEIRKAPFVIRYFQNEHLLLQQTTPFETDEVKIAFEIDETEVLMGGGARALGMNRRGHKLELYNRAHYGYETKSELMNFTLPIVLSSKGYMLHFDNPTTGFIDLDSNFNNRITYEAFSGAKRFQLIANSKWEDILRTYHDLTGYMPLQNRWAMGNFSSRFGYRSQEEVLSTIAQFKKNEIPVDAIILDLFWFGKEITGTMGNLAFDQETFPEPKKMMQDLKKQGVKTILISEPFVVNTSNRFEEAVAKDVLAKDSTGNVATYDFFFGHTGLIDVFHPKAKKWFWDIYSDLKSYGVDGWWGDLGEPEVHPDHLLHYPNLKAREVHNIYGSEWAKLIAEGYQNNFPNQRPFILMRSGYSGAQKHGMIPWSGDVNRTWGGLQSQMEISLQMGLQGMAYMHSDLGGFAGDLLDDELYVRWLQYGVFQPIYRPHAQEDLASEPVFRSDFAKQHAKKAIELRYELLPYNYHLTYQNSTTGMPLMRPLFFEEPENFQLYSVANSYLWGDAFLVSPVIEKNQQAKEIYFPQSAEVWMDYYSKDVFEGGKTYLVETSINHIPTFVKGGSFLLKSDVVQTTEDYTFNNLKVEFYLDESQEKTSTSYYNDDGKSASSLTNEAYEKVYFQYEKTSAKNYQIQIEKEVMPNFTSELEVLDFEVFNWEASPKWIKINGQKVEFEYKNRSIQLNNIHLNKEKTTIEIKI
ncbi:MAG: DUF4968 domain-containing protein [Flavobacteriaceae bacterium]|nr:DUF4968 domain-containing protein [Flavobacteriaceae bacterium]